MRTAVVTFPGSNCDDDCAYVMEHACGWEVERLWHKDKPHLKSYDLVVLPGGFSYGDYLRCGAIAAVSPVMESLRDYAANSGLVMGICNGFQMLCELRLLPGALVRNERTNFICQDNNLTVENNDNPWAREAERGDILSLPIAHGEGRFIISEEERRGLVGDGRVILTYTDSNPNGSVGAIAGICNETKNVFGLMPHLERASDLRSGDGMKIWRSIASAVRERAR